MALHIALAALLLQMTAPPAPSRRLPPDWSPATRPVPAARNERQVASWQPDLVDETGRYLYSSRGSRWDLAGGGARHFGLKVTGSWTRPPERWWYSIGLAWGAPLVGDLQLLRADGGQLVGLLSGPDYGGLPITNAAFVASLGRPAERVDRSTGLKPWLRAGIPILSGGWTDREDLSLLPKTAPYKRLAGTALLLVGRSVRRLRLPAQVPMSAYTGVSVGGGLRPDLHKLYTGYFDSYLLVDFSGLHPSIKHIPRFAVNAKLVAGGGIAGWLADDTLVQAVAGPGPKGATVPHPFNTWIFDPHSWKWEAYPDLIIYGRSFSGKYVVYGWYGSGTMQVARIRPYHGRKQGVNPRCQAQRSAPYATVVYDARSKKWAHYDGLLIYGASTDGRYVAYSWAPWKEIGLARVKS